MPRSATNANDAVSAPAETRPTKRRAEPRARPILATGADSPESPPLTAPAGYEPMRPESWAAEMVAAQRQMLDFYRTTAQMSPAEAAAHIRGAEPDADLAWDRQRVLEAPVHEVSWFALARLVERDPGAVAAAWSRVREAARTELASGERTARALTAENTPYEQARFVALRDAFADSYEPRNAIEAALVDVMAQGFDAYVRGTERAHRQDRSEARVEERTGPQDGTWQPMRLTTAEAITRSTTQAEQGLRRFKATLKTLHDLRRAPAVTITAAGQVNIGVKRVNVAPSGDGPVKKIYRND